MMKRRRMMKKPMTNIMKNKMMQILITIRMMMKMRMLTETKTSTSVLN